MKPVILFDMDGVIINVADSYREAICRTVEAFTWSCLKKEEIDEYKFRGGLNNDWDLSLAIIKDRGVDAERDEVIDKFQEIYLGSDFNGLIETEVPFTDSVFMKRLKDSGSECGIVTGRPRPEADYILDKYDLAEYFKVMVTMDDLPEGRGKPEPDGIELAMKSFDSDRAYYLGDSVDDMRAALSAGTIPVGVSWSFAEKVESSDRLREAGAETILAEPGDLWRLIR